MTSVKGLFKGLRYISQIFENEEEMQIGYPTDVKHVAHIGMDGPSANTPSWMNKYPNNQENLSVRSNGEPIGAPATQPSPRDPLGPDTDAPVDSPTARNSGKRRHSKRRHSSSSGPMGSPPRDQSDSNKPRRSKKSLDLDAPHQGSSHKGRRVRGSSLGSESPSQDPPGIPKSRRKKSKDGSTRSSRSKGSDSLPENFQCLESESRHGLKSNETCPDSVLKEYGEGNEIDEISRGVRAL